MILYLPRCAAKVADLAARDSARFALTAVRLRRCAGGWRVEATDGRKLGILRGGNVPSDADRAAADSIEEPPALTLETLLPPREYQQAFKNLPKDDHRGTRHVGVLLGNNESLLVAGEGRFRVPAVDGRWPDTDGVLPRTPAMTAVRVNPELLIQLLQVAAAVAKTVEGAPAVELLFFGPDKPLGVITQGAEGTAFDGILMPIS